MAAFPMTGVIHTSHIHKDARGFKCQGCFGPTLCPCYGISRVGSKGAGDTIPILTVLEVGGAPSTLTSDPFVISNRCVSQDERMPTHPASW